MADQPKKKGPNAVTRNDSRRNGKAFKKSGATRNKPFRPSELQKALWGQGAMRRITRPAPSRG